VFDAALSVGTLVHLVRQGADRLGEVEEEIKAALRQAPVLHHDETGLRVALTRDHLSAISGITADGRLFMQTQEQACHSPDVVRFLRVLLRKIAGKLLVIWDGAPIHRGQPIKEFLARGAARRLHLEQLPG
jgi:DDE superfamily endonuclease